MKGFIRVLRFARPVGVFVPQFILFTLLATVFSVVNFTVLIPLLQVLFDKIDVASGTSLDSFTFSITYFKQLFYAYLTNYINTEGKTAALYFICVVIVSSVFLANVFRYLSALILAKVRVNVITNLRNSAFEALLHFDLQYFSDQKKGDLISRVTIDVQEVELSVVSTLKVLFREPFLIIGYFIALFMISIELTIYTLILIPSSGALIALIAKRLKKHALKSQESLGRINNILDETIAGMRIIKAFTAMGQTLIRFRNEVKVYAQNNYKIAAKFHLAAPISEFLGVFVLAIILLIGGKMVLSDSSQVDAAEFIGFLILFSQVLNPAKAIANSFSNINRGLASAERIFKILDAKPEVVEKEGAVPLEELQHGIVFQQVSFAYENTPVLEDISMRIEKGEVVALVGPSGSGKSTIVDLIPRFYDVKQGKVIVDGKDIQDYKIQSLREKIGIVTQESILFNDSIANNIAFGLRDVSREKIIEAAKVANAHDFILQLEHGYDTTIGERGVKLSGGQQQRISIARAVLKNPALLILDEATSALDSASEKLVQEAIHNLMQDRTALVIAHRLSTIQHADRIYVVQNGKIVQQGKHHQLLTEEGLYKNWIKMQTV